MKTKIKSVGSFAVMVMIISGIFVFSCLSVSADTVEGTYGGSDYTLKFTADTETGTASVTGFTEWPSVETALTIPQTVSVNDDLYTVTKIAASAFSGEYNTAARTIITSVDFPETITEIGDSAFLRCTKLAGISTGGEADKLPDISVLGANAFSRCNALAIDLVIPQSLTVIPKGAFYANNALKSISLHDNVEAIGASAFHEVYLVESLTIPEKVTTVDFSAFTRMQKLAELYIKGDNVSFIAADTGNANRSPSSWNCERTGTADGGGMGGNVVSAGTAGYTKFKFDNISSLKNCAAYLCSDSSFGFNGESNKKYFVKNNFVFTGDVGAGEYVYTQISPEYTGTDTEGAPVIELTAAIKGRAVPADADYALDFSAPMTDGAGNTYIINKVCDSAFVNDEYLTAVNTGNAETIGVSAFENCGRLSDVTFGNALVSIGERGFNGSGITAAELNSGLVSLGKEAFNSCLSLEKVFIPKTVTQWNGGAFKSCEFLTEVIFEDGLTAIGDEFWMCKSLQNYVIPASVTKIPSTILTMRRLDTIILLGDDIEIQNADKIVLDGLNIANNIRVIANSAMLENWKNKITVIENPNNKEFEYIDINTADAVTSFGQRADGVYTYKKGFVYAVSQVENANYIVGVYKDGVLSKAFGKPVNLEAGQYMMFDFEDDKVFEEGNVSVFLFGQNLRPYSKKVSMTFTK